MRITSSPCSAKNHGAPQLVLNRERGAVPCVCVCVCMCVCVWDRERERAREKETHHIYVNEGGYVVYKGLNAGMIVDPRALHVQLSSELRCVCVCACVHVWVFAHHQSRVCGAITEIRLCHSNGCPQLSARILCQDNKLKRKSESDEQSGRKGIGPVEGGEEEAEGNIVA